MSGAQTSTFGNLLFDPLMAGRQQAQQNQLMQQQQELSQADLEQESRAANWITTLDPSQRPAAYQAAIAQLKAAGFAKNAPAEYPGDQANEWLARQSLPVSDQYKLGIVTPPGTTAAINAALTPGVGQPGAQRQPSAAPVPAYGGGGANQVPVPAEYMPYFQEASQRTGIPVDLLIAQARQESGFNPGATGGAGEVGIMQIKPSTAASPGFGLTGVQNPDALRDPRTNINFGADYLAARGKAAGADFSTPAGQAAALRAYNGGGDPNYVANVFRYVPAAKTAVAGTTAGTSQGAAAGGAPVVVGDSLASPGGLGGSGVVGAQPSAIRAEIAANAQKGAYTGKDVVLSSGASNAPGDMENVEAQLKLLRDAGSVTLLGVGPTVEAKNPGTNAKLQTLAAQYGAKFQPLPADQMSPDGVHPNAAGYATLKTATAPPGPAPQGGRYQVASNAPVAPPAAPAPAPAAAAVPPAPVAQPPAPAPTQPQGPQPQGPQPTLPHASEVPTGTSSPQYQQAMDLQRRAMILDAQPDPTGRLKTLAAGLRSQAALILQSDSVVNTQEGQLHTMTGKLDDPAKPLPHYVYDSSQHAYIDTTGTNKPEFEPAQRDTAVAQRDVMELGPLVAAGTATPEQVARYNVAATTYQQPTLRENPVTKETVRVNTRELPPGFPSPSGPGTGGASGGAGGGSQVVMPGLGTAQQQIERDPAAYKVSESQYDRDSKEISGIADAGRAAQADQIRIKEMQDVLQRFSSGPGTEARTAASAWLQRWLPSGITGWEKESANLSGSDAAQAFAKLALTGAGSQERSVLGNRGGFQAIRMFQAANPSVNLQDATNKSILDMQLISNQANQDYAQAALSHFADNEQKFSQTHQYDSLAQFDRNWNAQRSPQVYAAAMGAIGGQPAEQWSKGLSDAEYARALKVVEQAKPGAIVNGKSGRIIVQPPAPAPPPGFQVIQ